MIVRRSLVAASFALVAACGAPRDAARTDSAASGATSGSTAAPVPGSSDGARPGVEGGAPAPRPDRPLGACADGGAARDSLCFHAERELALEPGAAPFRLVVDARGARADSMDVALRIVRDDTTWHRDGWSTFRYGAYDARRPSADSLRRRTDFQLRRLVDLQWSVGPTIALQAGARDRDRAVRETIMFHLKETDLRARHAVPAGSPTPPALYDSLRADTALAPRAQALVDELRDRPAYRYFAGGELTSAWAWSPRERRLVRVYECC